MPVEGRTGVVIPVPGADLLLARAATRSDGVRPGVPAHVSLLYPFVPVAELHDSALGELGEVFERQTALDVEFDRCRRRDNFVFLQPSPLQPVMDLVDELRQRWPDVVPYEGRYGHQVEPHLTITLGADAAQATAVEDLVATELPLAATLREAWLVATRDGQWTLHERFPFQGTAPR
jgi:hypothetical protein